MTIPQIDHMFQHEIIFYFSNPTIIYFLLNIFKYTPDIDIS